MQISTVAITQTQPLSVDENSSQLIDRILADEQHPLVLFTRGMCEFCWAMKKFLAHIEAPYRLVELDSDALREHKPFAAIRTELQSRNGSTTVPQVYLAGQFIGGATDSFQAWNSGELQKGLQSSGVPFKPSEGLDTYQFLHGWLHGL